MSEQYYMCNATSGDWAYVSLYYYSTNCTLIRYDYADPYKVPVFFFYFYIISYYIITFIIFPLLFVTFFFYLKTKIVRYVSPEGDALLARHPAGYWGEQVGENAPFGGFFRNLMRGQN